MKDTLDIKIKPLLRWAGGKSWLTKNFQDILPNKFNNYFEPFLGGASVALYLSDKNKLKKKINLSDINSNLINFYNVVANHPLELIISLEKYENTKEMYYDERGKVYHDFIERAAQFYYLNKTSFNGIYRENLKGEYNVPFGNKVYKKLFDENLIMKVSYLFRNAEFSTKNFTSIKDEIKKNDLIFLDPPYTVAHENNGFVKYNQKIFSWEDQIELKKLIDFIESKNAYYILTNAYHSSILELYKNVGKQIILERPSVVGGKNAKRQKYKELLISNIK